MVCPTSSGVDGQLAVAALEGGTLVLVGLGLGAVLVLIHRTGTAAGSAAQARAAGIRVGIDLAAVVKHRQATLHVVEFAGIDHVFRLRHEDLLDLDLRILDAGVGGRVAGEDLGQSAGLLLFERLDFLEEVDERSGIVAGLVEILEPQIIGFGFHGLREAQEAEGDGDAGALADGVPGPSAHEDQGDGGIVDDLPLGLLPGAVPGGDVGNLVGHDAGEFGFRFGLEDEARVDEEESAGKGEGVDFLGIQDLDGERHFGVRVADEILPDAVDVFGDDGVVNDLGLALHFLRQLLAECDFLFQGVEVQTFADVAVADFLGIFLLVPRLLVPSESTHRQQADCGQHCHRYSKAKFHSPKTPDTYTIRPMWGRRVAYLWYARAFGMVSVY